MSVVCDNCGSKIEGYAARSQIKTILVSFADGDVKPGRHTQVALPWKIDLCPPCTRVVSTDISKASSLIPRLLQLSELARD